MMMMMVEMIIVMVMRMSIRKVPGAFRSEVQGRSVGRSSNGDSPLISNAMMMVIMMRMIMMVIMMVMMMMMMMILMVMMMMMTSVKALMGIGVLYQIYVYHCVCTAVVFFVYFHCISPILY